MSVYDVVSMISIKNPEIMGLKVFEFRGSPSLQERISFQSYVGKAIVDEALSLRACYEL